ncbi:MAG: urease accessory protein UreF [Gammaproteobacteria bacterium]|nr:urease accessory protein UreF [Gammaproteobacteria bacterium]
MSKQLSMIRLWQLISPALPIGSFSYSQSLEYAIDSGQLKTESDIEEWLTAQMNFGLANLDLAVLYRLMQAWQSENIQSVRKWNSTLLAFRESAELHDEDCQVGYALTRLLTDLEVEGAAQWQRQKVSYVTLYALVCQRWRISSDDAVAGFIWAWCENMVAAAVKLLSMGQTAGQKMLLHLGDCIEPLCRRAKMLPDNELGGALPGLAMASAFHETQYSRLFRS